MTIPSDLQAELETFDKGATPPLSKGLDVLCAIEYSPRSVVVNVKFLEARRAHERC
jgi:hypothetical protein